MAPYLLPVSSASSSPSPLLFLHPALLKPTPCSLHPHSLSLLSPLRPSPTSVAHIPCFLLKVSCQRPQDQSELPPASKQEAVLQARSSLAALVDKAVKTLGPSTVRQKKQQRQLRFRIEIPLLDDSVASLAALVVDLLDGFSTGKRGVSSSIAIFFSDPSLLDEVRSVEIQRSSSNLKLFDIDYQEDFPADAQLVIVVAPTLDCLIRLQDIARCAATRPVVLLNPAWSPEEERETTDAKFLGSFDVIYSFTALAIQGLLGKTEGAVFKHVKSGAPGGRPWLIFVKEGDKMSCVSSLKKRPDAAELENALYNTIAANSPVTKSVKFLRGLFSGR